MTVLVHGDLLLLHAAAVDAGLASVRDELLASIEPALTASLPSVPHPAAQLLSDLGTLNRIQLEDGSTPIEIWLRNAIALSKPRVEARTFQRVLASIAAAAGAPELLLEVPSWPVALRLQVPERAGVRIMNASSDPGGVFASGAMRPHGGPKGGFVGRKHVWGALEFFAASQPSGYFILQGESGAGKSAFLVEYARRTGCVAYFNERSRGIVTASKFAKGLASELCERFGLPPLSAPSSGRQGAVLADLLETCSRRLPPGERLVIGIDAVDEVERENLIPDANILHLPAEPPEGVYFVLTSRGRVAPLSIRAPLQVFDLRHYEEENARDARDFVEMSAERREVRAWLDARTISVCDLVDELAARCENNFMYLCGILDGIASDRYSARELAGLPSDLESYYQDRWSQMDRSVAAPVGEKAAVAYVLTEARKAVAPRSVALLARIDESTATAVLIAWSDLLIAESDCEEIVYRIAHESFREFLYWQDCVQAAGVSLAGNHKTRDGMLSTLLGRCS
jgi:hypothetical protein